MLNLTNETHNNVNNFKQIKHALDESTIVAITDCTGKITYVNDTFGDHLLQKVSELLKACITKENFVSRFAGDEFVIILKNVNEEETSQIANRIIISFTAPFFIENEDIYISASLGISMYPNDGKDVDTLINNADIAMYLAKQMDKNNYQFFTKELNDINIRKMMLEKDLRKAI